MKTSDTIMNKHARLCRFLALRRYSGASRRSLQRTILTALLALITLTSCGSSEPEWADPEAHEKTEQLREQYTPLIVGAWHYEKALDEQRAFEQLTFNADGTFSGQRKWQIRQLATIDGQEQYTDWEDMPEENGTFMGTWTLKWERNSSGVGENRLLINARWDNKNNHIIAYGHQTLFGYADESTLRFAGYWQDSDGWTNYERGEAEPSF